MAAHGGLHNRCWWNVSIRRCGNTVVGQRRVSLGGGGGAVQDRMKLFITKRGGWTVLWLDQQYSNMLLLFGRLETNILIIFSWFSEMPFFEVSFCCFSWSFLDNQRFYLPASTELSCLVPSRTAWTSPKILAQHASNQMFSPLVGKEWFT